MNKELQNLVRSCYSEKNTKAYQTHESKLLTMISKPRYLFVLNKRKSTKIST